MYRVTVSLGSKPHLISAFDAPAGTLGYINNTDHVGLRTYNGLVDLCDPNRTWTPLFDNRDGPELTPLPTGTIITIVV